MLSSHNPLKSRAWIFPWRRQAESQLPKLCAIVAVTCVFGFALGSLRVRVASPSSRTTSQASVIQVNDAAVGYALTLRAREGGPFPSRFDPSAWPASKEIEARALADSRWRAPVYVPALRNLPGQGSQSQPLAPVGEAVFPRPDAPSPATVDAGAVKLLPLLYPLASGSAAMTPVHQPPFSESPDPAMTATHWPFLLRISPDGRVLETIALSGGGESANRLLDPWLRGLVFPAIVGPGDRWLPVEISFTHQSDHGSDPR